MNGTLKVAVRKSRHYFKREWCGCLTPCEIIALVTAGAKPSVGHVHLVERAREQIKKGICNSNWFYFQPNGIVMNED